MHTTFGPVNRCIYLFKKEKRREGRREEEKGGGRQRRRQEGKIQYETASITNGTAIQWNSVADRY